MYQSQLTVVFSIFIFFLSSCGFKLRQSEQFDFQRLFIEGKAYPSLSFVLRNEFANRRSVSIVSSAQEADAVLRIIEYKRINEVLSLNHEGQVRELRLIGELHFSLEKQGEPLLAATTIRLTRDMTYSEAAALAKEEEDIALYQDIEKDLAQQIVRRLAKTQ